MLVTKAKTKWLLEGSKPKDLDVKAQIRFHNQEKKTRGENKKREDKVQSTA